MRFESEDGEEKKVLVQTKIKMVNGEAKYYDKWGDEVLDSKGEPMVSLEEEGYPTIAVFRGMTPKKKAVVLKERAAADNEKSRDKWHQMNSKTYIP